MSVTRDPKHPDFPHGTTKGYSRGCRGDDCPGKIRCRAAWSEACRRRNADLKAGVKVRGRVATDVLAHVTALLAEVPEASTTTIGTAAGVSPTVFIDMRRTNRTTYPMAEKVLAVQATDLFDHLGYIGADEVRHMARKLQALGYPINWVEDHTTVGTGSLQKLLTKCGADVRRVRVDCFNAIRDLYRTIGNRPADPERDGIDNRAIAYTRHHAALAGYERPGMIDATIVIQRCERLLTKVERASWWHIARAAAVDSDDLDYIRSKNRIHQDLARTLMALTPDAVAETLGLVDPAAARHMVGTTRACGFPTNWITARTGVSSACLVKLLTPQGPAQQHIERKTHDAIEALFKELDGRAADPIRDGLRPAVITQAKTVAARGGYYPPACYNDDGTLNPRFIPDHPWTIADNRCIQLLDLAHALVTIGFIDGQPAARAAVGEDNGAAKKDCQRVVADLGLRYLSPKGEPQWSIGQAIRHNKPIIDRVKEVYAAYDNNRIGPVEAALDLGLRKMGRGKGVPSDHPEAIAWRAKQAAEDELEQAPQAA